MTSESQLDKVISWQTLEGMDHFQFSILHIDDDVQRAEVLFKFEAHMPIFLHRHCSLNKLLVIEGEHLIYRQDGSVKDIRPTGRYVVVPADDEPHSESGGDGGAIVLFSVFANESGPLYEVLDPERNVVAAISMADLVALSQAAAA